MSKKELELAKLEIKKLKAKVKKLRSGFLRCKTCKHKELITIECKKDDCKYEGKCGNKGERDKKIVDEFY